MAMGFYTEARRPDGVRFQQWRPSFKGESPPTFGPGTLSNCCIVCGARYEERMIDVPARGIHPARSIPRTDIWHFKELHLAHDGEGRGSSESGDLPAVRRSYGDRDDD